jgi:hypothetical protein
MKSRRMWCAEHLEPMGKGRHIYRVLVGILRERGHLENFGIDLSTELKCILNKWVGRTWIELISLRLGKSGRSL